MGYPRLVVSTVHLRMWLKNVENCNYFSVKLKKSDIWCITFIQLMKMICTRLRNKSMSFRLWKVESYAMYYYVDALKEYHESVWLKNMSFAKVKIRLNFLSHSDSIESLWPNLSVTLTQLTAVTLTQLVSDYLSQSGSWYSLIVVTVLQSKDYIR